MPASRAKRWLLCVIASMGVVLSAPCLAADVPETLAGAKVVTVDDVQKLQSSGVVLVDARIAAEYAEAHIKGAISIPYHEKSDKSVSFDAAKDEFAANKLPADKAAPLVIYCNGPSCWKSYKASIAAIKAGFTNVLWFRDGFPAWQAKSLPTELE